MDLDESGLAGARTPKETCSHRNDGSEVPRVPRFLGSLVPRVPVPMVLVTRVPFLSKVPLFSCSVVPLVPFFSYSVVSTMFEPRI